ncbi:DUF982 domain-containing protein [Labrys miyagiensis]|uniref:DUF982 domain-containing protein n=1 Tax=Labrys miyagiensis TaxID=346912 RepID=UPI003D67820E
MVEALELMRCHWPDDGGDIYDRALDACCKAILDRASVEAARCALVDALSAAGLLVVRDFEHILPVPGYFGPSGHNP